MLTERKTPVHREIALSRLLSEQLLTLMSELELTFACIDLILRPDGAVVFLEANPSGQWLWVEDMVGLEITKSLVLELLADK
jgi:glutathione synthase/RimK-type ligase-like ATP-grasp enzyme